MINYSDKILSNRPIKFILTGGIAFSVEYTSFIFLVYFVDSNLVISNIVSFGLGLVTSFLLNKNWVFGNKEKSKRQPILYLALALFNLAVSTLIIGTVGKIIEPAIIKIVMVIMIAVWNYFIYKYFIFSYK
jgi:putative flippase GtrA